MSDLQDWTSPALDLSCPSTFRDLSKPIGALNPDRLAGFCERYDSLLHDPDMDAFHYGSHYSSAGVVLWYLLRLQPFTELGRNLQVRSFGVHVFGVLVAFSRGATVLAECVADGLRFPAAPPSLTRAVVTDR